MDAVILAEMVVKGMDHKTLYAFAVETLIDTYDEMSEHELYELADALGYGDDDETD